jgi:hypothetical protein
MRNLKTYFNHKKEFFYFKKIRYAQGVGDVCAAILHSKLIGPITYLVTGDLEPCPKCQNRRTALNLLFPIPFWRLFFKNDDFYNKSLNQDFEKIKKETPIIEKITEKPRELPSSSFIEKNDDILIESNNEPQIQSSNNSDSFEDYMLVSESRTEHENLLLVNRIYKKI